MTIRYDKKVQTITITVGYDMLTTTTKITSEQAEATENVKDQAVRLMEYAAVYPNNEVVFHKSNMDLIVQSDASYLSRSKARSVAGGVMYFGDRENPKVLHGAVHCVSVIIDVVVSSVGEAEYGSTFINGKQAENLRTISTAMGHPSTDTQSMR